jgi:hypothetical protein
MAEFYLGWKGRKKSLQGWIPGESASPPNATKEEKAAATRGLRHIGKQTFDQYEILVSNGYKGSEVMKWTKHRSNEEIARFGLRLRADRLKELAGRGKPRKRKKVHPVSRMTACPICNVVIREARLPGHLQDQHSRPSALARTSRSDNH